MNLDDRKRLRGLLGSITYRRNAFLDRCLETKYLAVTDPVKASLEYCSMAKEVLCISEFNMPSESEKLLIDQALADGRLTADFLRVLRDLRRNYLDDVLRPAVQKYLRDSKSQLSEIEFLYKRAMKIDGLIEVGKFLNRVQDS